MQPFIDCQLSSDLLERAALPRHTLTDQPRQNGMIANECRLPAATPQRPANSHASDACPLALSPQPSSTLKTLTESG